MADSYLLQVEKAIASLIQACIPTIPVYRGRGRFGREPVPMVSVLMEPNLNDGDAAVCKGSQRTADITYMVNGWVEDDEDAPCDPAHELLAEVKKALSDAMNPKSVNYRLGKLVDSVSVGVGLVRPPDQNVSDKAMFWLTVSVKIIEDISDPYKAPRG